jgi:hypothetical protein
MTKRKEIIYPKFLECIEHSEDSFWKQVFEDLVHGKSPHGTYISKNFLCCNYKNREFSFRIDENMNGKELYDKIYHLLHDKLGLRSQRERDISLNLTIEKGDSESEKDGWGCIKKKNIKEITTKY